MLNRITLLLSARALSRECRRASERQDLQALIDHADALKEIAHTMKRDDDSYAAAIRNAEEEAERFTMTSDATSPICKVGVA